MLIVYAAGPAWDVPDVSPFVFKLVTWLRMSGIEHRVQVGNPLLAPKGKVPYVDDEGRKLADSSLIIEHLKGEGRGAPLAGDRLAPRDAAIATAFKGMIEGELYFVLTYTRWIEDAGFSLYRKAIARSIAALGVPSLLAPAAASVMRREFASQIRKQGMGRHDPETVHAFGRKQLDAVADHLAGNPYFMGDEPGTIDATVFAFVDSFLGTPLCPPLRDHVRSRENLVGYCTRMRERYWSDFDPVVASPQDHGR